MLTESSDFTVIGVLGAQGVGKSTIMSLLAGAQWSDSSDRDRCSLHEPTFPPQSAQTALRAAHQTSGIDFSVTPERLLLLDTQALLSPSVMLELQQQLQRRGDAQGPSAADSPGSAESLVELQSLRTVLLVLSVCHIVVCVHDAQSAAPSLRLLRTAQMLRHRIPDLSCLALATPATATATASAAAAAAAAAATATATSVQTPGADDSLAASIMASEHSPRLAFVFNRQPESAFQPDRLRVLHQILGRLFTNRATAAAVDKATIDDKDNASAGAPVAATAFAASAVAAPAEPMLFVLPEHSGGDTGDDVGGEGLHRAHLGFEAEALKTRDALLAMRRGAFAKSLTEKDWWRGVQRVWELIRRSNLLAEYTKTVQKLHLYA